MSFRTLKMTTLISLIGVVSACKKPVITSNWAYIIGDTNDIETIGNEKSKEIPPQHLNATVILTTNVDSSKRKFCSGTLIEPESSDDNYRIITARHCFAPTEDENRDAEGELLTGACESTKIFFGFFRDEIESREMGECRIGSFRTDFESDLAVFTLVKNPSEKYQPAAFWSQGPVPRTGRKARIVHFPTVDRSVPENQDKVFYEPKAGTFLPVGQLTVLNCDIAGVFDPTDWNLDHSLAFGTKHTCDQKKGSSGSSLWDVETNTILGINWGGISITYNNPIRTETWNVATNADYVALFLKDQHEDEKKRILSAIPPAGAQSADAERNGNESGKVKKKVVLGCGTIDPSRNSQSSGFLTFCLLALPIALLYSYGVWREFFGTPRQPKQGR